jgi:hypothetical protein
MLEDEKMKIEQERLMKIQLEQEEHQRKIEKIK